MYLGFDQFSESLGHGSEREFRLLLAFGATEMGGEHQPRPATQKILNRGQAGTDACVIRNLAVFQRHIIIHPNEDALPFRLEVAETEFRH